MNFSIQNRPLKHFLSIIALFIYPAWLVFDPSGWSGDHNTHVWFAQEALKTGEYPPHFLYHILLNSLTGFSGHWPSMVMVAVIILLISISLKLAFSIMILDKLNNKLVSLPHLFMFCTLLFFVSPIMNWWQFPSIYRGQFTPTVWHNPTSIILMPFSLAIIYLVINKTKDHWLRDAMWGSVILGLSVLVKPSFALAFLPTIYILALIKKFTWKECLIYSLPAIAIMAWQFFENYTSGGQSTLAHHRSSIIISPFTVWYGWAKTPVGSLLVSFAFPGVFLYFFLNQIKNKNMMLLAWLLVLVSMTSFFLFAEEGDKTFHGNFFWGTIPAVYILFLATMIELFCIERQPHNGKHQLKVGFCYVLLYMHFISGIWYYLRSVWGHDFYA